jgi:hypothetical protein
MRFLDRKQRKLMARLVEIAGSPLLVEEAFAKAKHKGDEPTIDDVVAYILDHRSEWHARRGVRRLPHEANHTAGASA